MKTEVKALPKSEVLLTVELTTEEFAAYENDAAKRVSERVEIPGFRKGQAPKAFVIAQIGADRFFEETMSVALPRSYFKGVQEQKLSVISRPEVKVLIKSPLKYEARVAVVPEIKLKGYEKITVPSEPAEVTDKEIDDVVEQMRKYRATYKPLERAAQKGDRVEVSFQGYDEGGAALDKTKSENHPLFIGENAMVPGFEEQLIGMKTGEKKKFPVKFPKDFHHAPFQSKVIHFEVELKKAEEPLLPELTEEFVTQVMGEKKTVPEFRAALKADMKMRKAVEARRGQENVLLEKLLKEASFDVPPSLIEEEIDYMIEDLKREIEQRGLTYESYEKKLKEEKRDLRKEYEKEAEKRVRVRLILNHLFGVMQITATDDEMKRAAERLLRSTPDAQRAQMQKEIDSKQGTYLRLKNNIMLEKLFERFLGKVA